jgi:hypothetical protein
MPLSRRNRTRKNCHRKRYVVLCVFFYNVAPITIFHQVATHPTIMLVSFFIVNRSPRRRMWSPRRPSPVWKRRTSPASQKLRQVFPTAACIKPKKRERRINRTFFPSIMQLLLLFVHLFQNAHQSLSLEYGPLSSNLYKYTNSNMSVAVKLSMLIKVGCWIEFFILLFVNNGATWTVALHDTMQCGLKRW